MTVRGVAAGFGELHAWATDPRPRIGWGLPFFDQRSNGGMARSEICMVMAYSSVGKTTLALNIMRNNPTVPTLFRSVEMSWRQVVSRLAAIELGITTAEVEHLIREGEVPPVIQTVVDRYEKLVCDDNPNATVKGMKTSFEQATEILGEKPRLVVVDYMELLAGGGLMAKAEAIDKAAVGLRNFSRDSEVDCSTIVLHQIGVNDGGYKPLGLDAARYGGFQPMDYVVGAYAPRLDPNLSITDHEVVKNDIFLQLLKNRAGQAYVPGIKHHLDSKTLRLGLPSATWATPGYQDHWSDRA